MLSAYILYWSLSWFWFLSLPLYKSHLTETRLLSDRWSHFNSPRTLMAVPPRPPPRTPRRRREDTTSSKRWMIEVCINRLVRGDDRQRWQMEAGCGEMKLQQESKRVEERGRGGEGRQRSSASLINIIIRPLAKTMKGWSRERRRVEQTATGPTVSDVSATESSVSGGRKRDCISWTESFFFFFLFTSGCRLR